MSTAARRFPWIWYTVAMTLLVVVTLFPIPLLFFAAWFAETNGCTVNEGGIYPCMVNGADWGETLAVMGMSGWLLIATIPIFAAGATVWAIALLVHRVLWSRRKEKVT